MIQLTESEKKTENLVLVMGLTGAGKSFFINKLTGQNLSEGHHLRSCTERCQIVETNIGNSSFVIMDCPGFDDTTRSDTEILKEIAEQLAAIRLLGFRLKGIIYLHRITDNRMQGSTIRNLDLFTKLVGEDALPNVVLATTMWGNVKNLEEANSRDSELREEYWGDMRRKGSTTTRFDGTTESAQGIVSQLLGKRTVVLKVQHQLVDQNMSLNQTAAGAFLQPRVENEEEHFRTRLRELELELQFEKNSNRRMQAKRSQKRNSELLKQRTEDRQRLESKPGEEVESRLAKFRKESSKLALKSLQVLAAICTISFGIAGFVLGVGF